MQQDPRGELIQAETGPMEMGMEPGRPVMRQTAMNIGTDRRLPCWSPGKRSRSRHAVHLRSKAEPERRTEAAQSIKIS